MNGNNDDNGLGNDDDKDKKLAILFITQRYPISIIFIGNGNRYINVDDTNVEAFIKVGAAFLAYKSPLRISLPIS